jgi:undecaprenyl-diphosphatase
MGSRVDRTAFVDRAALVVASAGMLAASGRHVRGRQVSRAEAEAFRRVNQLPDAVAAPLWLVAQLGSVPAVPLVGAALAAAGERDRARRSVTAASGAYAVAKMLKRMVGRGRPADLLPDARVRGHRSTSSGYPSTHAAVATALVLAGAPPWRRLFLPLLMLPPFVGAGRMFKGAHLPADVVGGIGCGLLALALLPEPGEVRPAVS